MTRSAKLGKNISKTKVEILNLDPFGLWILVGNKEYFLDHEKYPWFLDARIGDLFKVSLIGENHLRWDALDVDIDVLFLENPEAAPLIYRQEKES